MSINISNNHESESAFSLEVSNSIVPIVVSYMGHHMREILREGAYDHYSLIFNKLRKDTLDWFNSCESFKDKNINLSVSIPDHHGRCKFKFQSLFEQHVVTFNLAAYASTGELYHASNYTYIS